MKAFIFLIISIFSFHVLQAQTDALRKKQFSLNDDGVILEGYDCVSYFKGKAEEGSSKYTFTYKGVIYWFSGWANMEAFKLNPEKYEPQYGGWCAYAMGAKNDKVGIDPETYKIVNGKLYVFYNKFLFNTLNDWNKDENSIMQKADTNWSKMLK